MAADLSHVEPQQVLPGILAVDGLHLVEDLQESLLRGLTCAEDREAVHLSEVVGSLNFLRLLVYDDHVVKKVNLRQEVREVDTRWRQLHRGRLCSLLTLSRGNLSGGLLSHVWSGEEKESNNKMSRSSPAVFTGADQEVAGGRRQARSCSQSAGDLKLADWEPCRHLPPWPWLRDITPTTATTALPFTSLHLTNN